MSASSGPAASISRSSRARSSRRAPACLKRLHNQPGIADYKTEMLDRTPRWRRCCRDIGPEVVGGELLPARRPREFAAHCSAPCTPRIKARGVDYLPSHRGRERSARDGGEFRLTTPQGEMRAGKVVLAAGNANMRLAPMVGLEAPMRPERGQIVVTERLRPFLRYPVVTAAPDRRGHGDDRRIPRKTSIDDRAASRRSSARPMADRARAHVPAARRRSTWCAPGARIRVMTAGRLPDLRPVGDASRRVRRCAAIPA